MHVMLHGQKIKMENVNQIIIPFMKGIGKINFVLH